MSEPCLLHGDITGTLNTLLQASGEHGANIETLLSQTSEIFEQMRQMNSHLSTYTVEVNGMRGDIASLKSAASDNQRCIEAVERIVTNGLSDKVAALYDNVAALGEKRSISDSFSEAFKWFKGQFARIVLVGIFTVFVWSLSKAILFQESSVFDLLLHYLNIPH